MGFDFCNSAIELLPKIDYKWILCLSPMCMQNKPCMNYKEHTVIYDTTKMIIIE